VHCQPFHQPQNPTDPPIGSPKSASRRTFGWAVVCCALLLGLVGDSAIADAAKPAKVQLRLRIRTDDESESRAFASLAPRAAAKLKNVKVIFESGVRSEGQSYADQIRGELERGTGPDVFWLPAADIAQFAKGGYIANLRSLATATTQHKDTDFYDGPFQTLTYNPATKVNGAASTVLWGLPRDVSTFAIYLNNDLIRKAKAEDPRLLARKGTWDWAAFETLTKKVSALGNDAKGFAMNTWWANYATFLQSGGGAMVTPAGACAADSQGSLTGLSFLAKLFQSGATLPYGENPLLAFQSGKVAMLLDGRWSTPGLREDAAFEWDIVRLPTGPAGSRNVVFWGAYVVSAKSKHRSEAWQLIRALTGPDIQTRSLQVGSWIPSTKREPAVANFLKSTPPNNSRAWIEGLTQGAIPEMPLWNGDFVEFSKTLDINVASVLRGETPIDAFAATICSSLQPSLTREGKLTRAIPK
jgi:multiple sugar transport system substrate-binding protein